MAILNTQFYKPENDALYSDGTVENEIYSRVCQNDKTMETDLSWPVFYHFSPLRENILNWYPFSRDCSVLEIGAGCGAITGLLCRRAGKVVSCELTMRRAKILFERYIDMANLEVMVGDFLGISFERRFDYVVINGVLEYAQSIMKGKTDDPFRAFLEYAKSLLQPGGEILLAIENRFGLKYFAGAPEDHLGRIFAGIDGYMEENSVRTFSKKELETLCGNAGLVVGRWYYPYPDYKFPTEIFTDDSVNNHQPSALDLPYDLPRAELFNGSEVRRTLMREGICGSFSNSFLLELVAEENEVCTGPSYVKISNNRKPELAICTSLYPDREEAEKRALYPNGWQHLQQMALSRSYGKEMQTLPAKYADGVLTYPYVRQESLRGILEEAARGGREEEFWDLLKALRAAFYAADLAPEKNSPEFAAVFGKEEIERPLHWQENLNIDLNGDNIFCGKQPWTVIDYEWIFPFRIPAEYVLWRMLEQLREMGNLRFILTDSAVLEFLDVSTKEIQVFQKWEYAFGTDYVGIRDLSGHRKAVYPIELNAVLEREKQQQILTSHLFLFHADEQEPLVLQSEARCEEGIWSVSFESEEIGNAQQIRWDPLEGYACRISEVAAGSFQAEACNAEKDEPEYTFATFDPQFQLCGDPSGIEKLTIHFRCQILEWMSGYFKREQERDKEHALRLHAEALLNQNRQENENLRTCLDASGKELEEKCQELQQTGEELRGTRQNLQQTVNELNETSQRLQQTEVKLGETGQELQQRERELNETRQDLQQTANELNETSQKLRQTEVKLDETGQELQQRERELNETRQDLQQTVNELNATNQKLRETEEGLEALHTEHDRMLGVMQEHCVKTAIRILLRKEI